MGLALDPDIYLQDPADSARPLSLLLWFKQGIHIASYTGVDGATDVCHELHAHLHELCLWAGPT